MARMMDVLSAIAPNTVKKFLSDIMYNYGIGVAEFEAKHLGDRYDEIKRYFGYQREHQDSMTVEEIQVDIKKMFSEFEEISIKYPFGVPDRLKEIKDMSNQQKSEYIEKFEKRTINICLHHSIIKRKHSYGPSLKDSLVARVMSKKEQIESETRKRIKSDEEFWAKAMKEFNKDEIAPF